MANVPRNWPRCSVHNIVMAWYNIDKRGGGRSPKYRCMICVADAKITVDRECENFRRHGRKLPNVAAQ